jgi:hypothetical protein
MASSPRARQDAYEAAKAGLVATNAPQSAHDELLAVFFPREAAARDIRAPGLAFVLPAVAALGAVLTLVVFEGPREICRIATGGPDISTRTA